MVILIGYINLNSGLNQGLKRPKTMQKSVKMPILFPADPEGPKDLDLDPGAKIDWPITIFDTAHSTFMSFLSAEL